MADEAGVSGRALAGVRDLDGSCRAFGTKSGAGRLPRACPGRHRLRRRAPGGASIEADGRLENLAELVGFAHQFEEEADIEGRPRDPPSSDVSLVADPTRYHDESSVVLMTLHTAKGLEFDGVFLIGLEDGVFPHLRALGEPDELEEERRLCYVGITRARRRLYLSHAWSRMLFGSTQYNPPSRFLKEIPVHLTDLVEGNRAAGGAGAAAARSERERVGGRRGRRLRSAAPDRRRRHPSRPPPDDGRRAAGDRRRQRRRPRQVGRRGGARDQGVGRQDGGLVRFPSVGEKWLLLSWAPLKRGSGPVPDARLSAQMGRMGSAGVGLGLKGGGRS